MGRNRSWYKLDNAAKMIPSSVAGADTKVFRIVCELREAVDPDCLQKALDETAGEFPHFSCVMKRGLFWYYLEQSSIRPQASADTLPALSPLYFDGRHTLLYRVTYFGCRVNLEVFHVLADGTGALAFLNHLINSYLRWRYGITADGAASRIPDTDRTRDAFDHYYTRTAGGRQLKTMTASRAYQIPGEKDPDLRNHLLEAVVPASLFLSIAHDHGTTAGVFMTALYIESILKDVPLRESKPVVISVPVNLRTYFHSDTMRNFFGIITIPFYRNQYDGNLASIVEVVRQAFEEQLSQESLRANMNNYGSLEHNYAIKVVPLAIKDRTVRSYYTRAQKGVTSTVSNLGKISLPERLTPYIDHYAAFMTSPHPHMAVATFENKMVFGCVTSQLANPAAASFLRRLVDLGIPVELASNDCDLIEN